MADSPGMHLMHSCFFLCSRSQFYHIRPFCVHEQHFLNGQHVNWLVSKTILPLLHFRLSSWTLEEFRVRRNSQCSINSSPDFPRSSRPLGCRWPFYLRIHPLFPPTSDFNFSVNPGSEGSLWELLLRSWVRPLAPGQQPTLRCLLSCKEREQTRCNPEFWPFPPTKSRALSHSPPSNSSSSTHQGNLPPKRP